MDNDNKEIVSVDLTDLDPSKFMFSEKKTQNWDFPGKNGKQCKGSKNFVEVYYEKPGQKLCFILKDVKSFNGIQVTDNFKKSFMSITMKEDMVKLVEKYLDTPICNLLLEHKDKLLKDSKKIKDLGGLRILYDGIIKQGKDKADNPGQKWDDQMTCTVYMKKKQNQVVVDDGSCVIEDLQMRPYAWTNLDGKLLKEVAVEVEKITFGDKIKIQGVYRLIVPDGEDKPKITSKRRMEQAQQQKQQKKRTHSELDHSGDDSTPPQATTSSTNSSATPPTAKLEPDTKKAKTS